MRRAALVIFACAGCTLEGTQPGEIPSAEGERIVVFAEPGLELCADSLRHMDEFIERLSAEFGLEPPGGDDRIRFHWLGADEIEGACGGPAEGCAPGGEIFSLRAPLDHELVHAVAAPLGLPRSLFAEGLAVAYEDIGRGPQSLYFLGDSPSLLDLVEAGQVEFSERGGYRIAGAYTSFLIGRFGVTDFLRVYSHIDRDADRMRVDQIFQDVFGISFEQSVAEFEALPAYLGPVCDQPDFGAKLMECSAPALTWDGLRLDIERELSCDMVGSLGPFDDKVLVLHTLTIHEQGFYELRMHGDDQEAEEMPDFSYVGQAVTGVSLQHCGGCDARGAMSTWIGSTPRLAELPAGVYSLRLHGPATETVALGFTLSRVPDP